MKDKSFKNKNIENLFFSNLSFDKNMEHSLFQKKGACAIEGNIFLLPRNAQQRVL